MLWFQDTVRECHSTIKNGCFFPFHIHLLHLSPLSINLPQANNSFICPWSHLYGAESTQPSETIWSTVMRPIFYSQHPRTYQERKRPGLGPRVVVKVGSSRWRTVKSSGMYGGQGAADRGGPAWKDMDCLSAQPHLNLRECSC